MMNVYNGNAVLDERGEAWVELPEWFEALNRDFRYQLTAIGAPGPSLHVGAKIEGNRFQIGGGGPGLEVSWQVTGTATTGSRREPNPSRSGEVRGADGHLPPSRGVRAAVALRRVLLHRFFAKAGAWVLRSQWERGMIPV